MIVIRLAVVLMIISAFILLGLYVYSKDKKYLRYFKQLAQLAGWFLLFVLVLFFVSRVLRI
ncbi:MAG: hypothetical protein Q8R74_12675 [Methylophilus sp.]|jgi:hypothetical protein|nr:hypothetical protein [Methylophilus sp.]MDP3609921.1 hypothetical protein [Methylophilus sp.]